MTTKRRTFVATLDDSPGVLTRVVSLFRRRAFNIISLNVGATHEEGISQMTLVMEADDDTAGRIVALLEKLVCVLEANDVTEETSVLRDMALFRVNASLEARKRILDICERYSARLVDVGPETVVVEATGTPDTIAAIFAELTPYGVKGMVQSGAVAMTCDPRTAADEKAA